MLVLLLILFTTVLAEIEEDKYVDLLPDEEKQQFLEKVARKILQDVESQEEAGNVQSGELNDEQLKQHSEYVRSVLKEEQENIRRSKGNDKEIEVKPISQEKDLGVKPLASLKVSLYNERQDLTLRKESGDVVSNRDSINNVTINVKTDNAPIIKRSVHDDNSKKSDETTSEILSRVSQSNITSGKLKELEAGKEKSESGNSDKKTLSKTGSEFHESINARDVEDRVKPVEEHNLSKLNKSDARNVSVINIHKGSRRSNNKDSILAVNVTERITVSTVETVKPTEIKSNEYKNVSGANEKVTTVTHPFQETSAKDNDTMATTIKGSIVESTTKMITNKDTEPIMKSIIDNSKDTKNAEITKSVRTSTTNNQENITSIPESKALVTKMSTNVPETTASATKMLTNVPETIAVVTNMSTNVPETTALVTKLSTNVPETTVLVTNMSTNETIVNTKIVRTEAASESSTSKATEQTTESTVPVNTTNETKIIVEDFPSASTISAIKELKILKPKKPIAINKLKKEVTTTTPQSEQSIEVTTKKTITHKIFVHKPAKRIVGPKAKKLAEKAKKDDEQNQNFIELQKIYYNDNDNGKVGKEYHVFEVPADQQPFIRIKEHMVEQPYFVPIYNYSPNNAYYNPKNRLGPNPGDSSTENLFKDDDNLNLDRTETLNVKMEYDSLSNLINSKRKKFGGKQKFMHTVNIQPLKNKEPKVTQSQVNPEDYLDSDYYFGRVRKLLLRKANEDFNKFPNSDETDHPAHSIQEGNLKDHVRAVRNILFQQKSFGLLEKDKYESIERELGLGSKRSESKEDKTLLRKGSYENMKTVNDGKKKNKATDTKNNIANDYYIGRQKSTVVTDVNQDEQTNNNFQKIGYLKNQNDVMDDMFRLSQVNVEKYIQEKPLTPATPLPEQVTKPIPLDKRKEVISLLRLEERKHKFEKKLKNAIKNDIETKKDVAIQTTGVPKEVIDLKVNVRRNDVVKVSVYLQVLNDMITLDNKALVQYDWLGTTVDIQASLQKLFELTSLVVNEENVHPADMEILRYVLFLHKLASEIIEANNLGAQLRNKLAISRSKKKQKKAHRQKDKGLINKVWLYLRKQVPEVDEQGALKQLNSFLMDVEDSLYDLHDAIRNIAKITKYKNQHWYQNLKDLYIETDEKHLLELLLHMSVLRLFSLIEESAKGGLEDDYIQYMKQNRKHCKQTLAEMMFVMELLEKYNKFVE